MKDSVLVLEQFLLDNNIDTEYFRNLNKNSSESYLTITNKLDLDKFLKEYFKSDFISEAFIWEDTEEGYEFWSSIHNKWREMSERYIDKNIYFGFGIDIDLNRSTDLITKNNLKIKL